MTSKKIINLFLVLSLLCCNYPAYAGLFDGLLNPDLGSNTASFNVGPTPEETASPEPIVQGTPESTTQVTPEPNIEVTPEPAPDATPVPSLPSLRQPISPLDVAFGAMPDNGCPMPSDVTVELDDGTKESIFSRGATPEILPSGVCPYLSSLPSEPANIGRYIDVVDLNSDCAICPSHVKDLIYAYYSGDSTAGSNLCDLSLEELKNCGVLEVANVVSHYQNTNPQIEAWVNNFLDSVTNRLQTHANNVMDLQTYDAQGYISLSNDEIGRLLKRWPEATSKYYAATRQHWNAYSGWSPRYLTLTLFTPPTVPGGLPNRIRIGYNLRRDLLNANISPAQALADFRDAVSNMTNIWPDFMDVDIMPQNPNAPPHPVLNPFMGRRESGSLNYSFMVDYVDGGPVSNTNYRPFYHANFIDPYPLFLFSRLVDSANDLDDAFNNIMANWQTYRHQALRDPNYIPNPNPPPLPPQEPTASRWAAAPLIGTVNRFAVIIRGADANSHPPPPLPIPIINTIFGSDSTEGFQGDKAIAFIEHVLRNRLNYPANNVAIYNVAGMAIPDVMAFQTTVNPIIQSARAIRANNPNAKIQLLFYFWGHGRSIRTEQIRAGQQPIDMAWFKDGGLDHDFWLGGSNSLAEDTLQDFANNFVNSNGNPNANDRVFDRIDFVDGSCESGAAIY